MTAEIQKKINEKIQEIINKAANSSISSNILLDTEQLELLHQLNIFCINQVLNDTETIKDPRKIIYKSSQEMKIALVALCLTRALTNHRSKQKYTKEFFEQNINIYSDANGSKNIDFGQIEENEAYKAINNEIIFDWMIYRDCQGRGINALVDEKTFNCGLEDFKQGGDPIYEFARFQRKYFEYKHRKELSGRESAQEAFRNTIIQQAAVEIAKQQMLAGQNPLELVNLLFEAKDYNQAISQILSVPLAPPSQTLQIENQNSSKKKHNKKKHNLITTKKEGN